MSSTPSLSYAAFGRFGRFQRHAFGCVACFTCGGPVMIILGILSIVSAAANMRGHRITAYGQAINAWQSSGSAALQATYASGSPSVVVTFPAAPLVNRSSVTATFTLSAQTSVTPLADPQTNDYPTTYNNALWFSGMGVGWPTSYDSSRPNLLAVSTGGQTVTIPAWKCADVASPTGCVVTTTSGRRLLSNSRPACSSYARVLSAVSQVALVGYFTNATSVGAPASLGVDPCATTYAQINSLPITAAQYQSDNTVCAGLPPTVVSAVSGSTPTVTLRSARDPYAVAEVQTQCSLNFGLSAKSLAAVGGFLVATGAIATCGVAFCIYSIRKSAGKAYGNQAPVIPAFGMAPQAQQGQGQAMMQPAPQPGYPAMQQAYSAPQQSYYVPQQPPAGAGAYVAQPGGYGRPPQYYMSGVQ